MKLARWLTTPPPATAWSLDSSAVAALRRDGRGVLHGAVQEVPAQTFELGPVGLQSVDPARLEPLVRSVHERVAGVGRPAVVLPTGWLRSHVLDFDQLPRKRAEVEDVVRWRLKRLLPVASTDLRVSWVQLAGADGVKRLVTAVGLRRALDTLEATFESVGLQPGLITSRVFALAAAPSADGDGPKLVVQGESGFVSLLLMVGDELRLLRTKPLGNAADDSDVVRRELDLNLTFIRDTLAVEGRLQVVVSLGDESLAAVVRAWSEATGEVDPAPAPAALEMVDAAVMASIGEARLAPLRVVVGGAA